MLTYGFSGSRVPSPVSLTALNWLCDLVPSGAAVMVGCARGIDQAARQFFPTAQVFWATDYGTGRGSFAVRSITCVKSVAAAGGLWAAFPSNPCPVGLMPSSTSSKCFCGKGSGTWASLALAVGLGVTCLVFIPRTITVPTGWQLQSTVPTGWELHPSIGGWFYIVPPAVSV